MTTLGFVADRNERSTVLIFGTGSLAKEYIYAATDYYSMNSNTAPNFHIAGRTASRSSWLARSAYARSKALGRGISVTPHTIVWEEIESLATVIQNTKPDLVLQLSSPQSAWTLGGNDEWSKLISVGGYGIASPLLSRFLRQTLKALDHVGHQAIVVNGCFPDIINAMMTELGHEIACGLGNGGIIEAFLKGKEQGQHSRRILANHRHVSDCISGVVSRNSGLPSVWDGNQQLRPEKVRTMLPALPDTMDLNSVTGALAVPIVSALCGENEWRGCLAAPHGRPGGYPVKISDRNIDLDLPSSMSEQGAIDWNAMTLMPDGVYLEGLEFRFTPKAEKALSAHSNDLAKGFNLKDIETVEVAFAEMKKRLT